LYPGYIRVDKKREPGYRLYPGFIRVGKRREIVSWIYQGYRRKGNQDTGCIQNILG